MFFYVFLLYFLILNDCSPAHNKTPVQAITTRNPKYTVGCVIPNPFVIIFRTLIDGYVKGLMYEKYLIICGIPSNGQNMPKIQLKNIWVK
jgi:hypothetical protein